MKSKACRVVWCSPAIYPFNREHPSFHSLNYGNGFHVQSRGKLDVESRSNVDVESND